MTSKLVTWYSCLQGHPGGPARQVGGIIPAARFDPAALTIQERYVPAANLPNNFFEVRAPDPLDTDEATFKLDHHLSSSQILTLSYFYQKGNDTQPLSGTGNIPWVDRDFK